MLRTLRAMSGSAPRRYGLLADVVLIVSLGVAGLAGHAAAAADPAVEAAPLGLITAVGSMLVPLALWWRRSAPLRVVLGLLVGMLLVAAAAPPGLYSLQVAGVLLVALFAVGAWSEATGRVVALGAVLFAVITVGGMSDGLGILGGAAFGLALAVLPIVAGYATRTRRRYVEEVEARLDAAERQRDERARRAVNAERARLARELHDVVAHHVSLIGVQAGAARYSLDGSCPPASEALSAIEESSRQAVGELRQLLSVLRPLAGEPVDPRDAQLLDDPALGFAPEPPQPGVDRLAALVAQWRRAGMSIGWDPPAGLLSELEAVAAANPAWSTACFRIVEEALTNVARHSSSGQATLEIGFAGGGSHQHLRLAIADAGPPRAVAGGEAGGQAGGDASGEAGGSGRGLCGMAERAAIFGGSVAAGPCWGGGFLVVATVPLPASGRRSEPAAVSSASVTR